MKISLLIGMWQMGMTDRPVGTLPIEISRDDRDGGLIQFGNWTLTSRDAVNLANALMFIVKSNG